MNTDRTPRPCLHKRADHQHGTRARYVLDKCRCRPCTTAARDYERHRARMRAYGRWDKLVDAEPARQHVRELMAAGMGLKAIMKAADSSGGTFTKLMYGTPRADGTRRPPSRRITRAVNDRIMNVTFAPAAGRQVDATPTRTRIRALVALGWSQRKLAALLSIQPQNFHLAYEVQRYVTRSTETAVRDLYDRLSMTLPPQETRYDKIAASRARGYAKARGWLPPLALDEDTLQPLGGLSIEGDYLDDAAITRRIEGDKSVQLTKAEAAEVVRRWRASGRSLNECERVTGLQPYRYKDGAA